MALRFDFSPGGSAEAGHVKVTDADVYDKEQGYGFSERSRMSDSTFLVDIGDGNYRVTATIGDAKEPACTTVRTNGERLVVLNLRTEAGQFARESFAVNVRGGRLRLTFGGPAPRIRALEIAKGEDQTTLFLAGDSTVSDWSAGKYPESGWGQVLPIFFTDRVAVANHAKSGRSSKSFLAEGLLDEIQKVMKPGDYLFVQFGHNDQKKDEERSTEPSTTYPEHLRKYIDAARTKGGVPILVTPVHRRYFEPSGELRNTHGEYLDAARRLAVEEGVPLIDLAEKSKQLLEELGPEGTKSIFLWGEPGEWTNYPEGIQDNTHFQERGSLRMAELVVQGIEELDLRPLALYVKQPSFRDRIANRHG
ncbi:rhamnogalacturonan acetylesterase [Paenibacillus sp.]|uniref:rhamnogalacturonan acetylesterase n=1 Tax=Paenibacillus sp. TaxID=58172 RepID=UPI002D4CB162|nr:rhamnogalacturonan acetylesterase [Paenibacillus sp.]HZG84009.1 rhamnogalacturonan acetylesterase [Paenibacillus sp.]